MKSDASTVDEYMKELPADRTEVFSELRKILIEYLPDYSESMKYNMPTYTKKNRFFAMASQKQYISLYFDRANAVKNVINSGMKCSAGKSCVRFKKADYIDIFQIKHIIINSYSNE